MYLKKTVVFLMAVLLTLTTVFSRDKQHFGNGKILQVAVYNNGKQFKQFGIKYAYQALLNTPGIKVETIDNLKRDTLRKYDTVVILTVTKLAKKDKSDADRRVKGTDWIKTVSNYVDSGGGLVLGHNAIGYKGVFSSYKLFPMIGVSKKRNLKKGYDVTNANHPVMAGMPRHFSHEYDHMEIIPGKNGKVLATDKLGRSMIVAGEVSRGRVVQIGFPMGIYWKDKTGSLPKVDKLLLLNAVKWAGAKPRYDISLKATAAGLLATTGKYNRQLKYGDLAKYRNLPMPKFDEAMIWLPSYWVAQKPKMVGLNSPEVIDTIMDNCQRMGFTKVGITAKAGIFYYPTKLTEIEEKRGCRKGFSPVGYMVKAARKRGLKVALIIFPFKSSREWDKFMPNITKKEYDKLNKGEMKLSDIDAKHKWSRGICPDQPAVRARAMAISQELIKKYQPDELYLDYIRYKDGYHTSCYCDYSLKQKAAFAAEHPGIPQNKIAAKFAEESIVSFVEQWNKFCKKLDPKLKTACYTISSPSYKAPKWVNRFKLDYHGKYVSRFTRGPESSLEGTANLMKNYSKWVKAGNSNGQLSPLVATYNPKSAERILTEFKIVADYQKKNNVKYRRVEFYDYPLLIKDKKRLTLDPEMVKGITQALELTKNRKF
ncbi:MAG: ThuA domain-containing protein [Victivallaceae bacterium]|nr:ThuA domain-containing protein [Victivallaceae bacterium]